MAKTATPTVVPAQVKERTSDHPGHAIVSQAVERPGLFEESKRYLGSEDIPKDRYYSEEFRQLEIERMWNRVWLMACREEDVPNVGDSYVFDLADWSILIVRSAPGEIRAFHNSCLHRGTQLCSQEGNQPEFVCPFHGWTYALDGSLKWIPGEWDFPHVDQATAKLPGVRVDTWGGFVFVNIDGQAPPLLDYLGVLPDHFEYSAYEERRKVFHISKIVRANWKVVFAAFAESYHIPFTHPQFCQFPMRLYYPTQFPGAEKDLEKDVMTDVLYGHVLGRVAIRDAVEREKELVEARSPNDPLTPTEAITGARGRLAISSVTYWVFPNFSPWIGNLPFVYRVLPYKHHTDMCVMDVMMLAPKSPDDDAAPVKRQWFGPDDELSGTSPLGEAGFAFDQDFLNLARVQRGLRAAAKPGITLANHQEGLIRNHDQILNRYVGTPTATA